jgi:predicted aspartyl protease
MTVLSRPRHALAISIALAGCSTAAVVSRATPPEAPWSITLHAAQPGGFLVVPAHVDGREATFVFDTGAGTTVLDPRIAQRLGSRHRGTVKTRDSSGHVDRLPIARMGELRLGDSTFTDVGAIVGDLALLEHHLCQRIDGILGANVMQTGALQIDYDTGAILLASKVDALPTPSGRSLSAALLPMSLPVIPVEADGVRFGLIIDSGSNGEIAIDASLVEALEVEHTVPALGTTSAGLLGSGGHDEAFAWPAVRVGTLDLEGADASTAAVPTIGNRILRSFTVRIDYRAHVATFWPNARPIPTGHVTFGFGWDYDARGEARVVFVRERSAAFAAGIREGERVERIGTTTIAGVDRKALCRLRRDWATDADAIEVVVAGRTHCLRRHSLFAEPDTPATAIEGACTDAA